MSTSGVGDHLTMESRDDGVLGDEADISMIFYVSDAANSRKRECFVYLEKTQTC